jgi:hypothetical protein
MSEDYLSTLVPMLLSSDPKKDHIEEIPTFNKSDNYFNKDVNNIADDLVSHLSYVFPNAVVDHSYVVNDSNNAERGKSFHQVHTTDLSTATDHSYVANKNRHRTNMGKKPDSNKSVDRKSNTDDVIMMLYTDAKSLHNKHFGFHNDVLLSDKEVTALITSIKIKNVTLITNTIMAIPVLFEDIQLCVSYRVHTAAKLIQRKGSDVSILMKKDYSNFLSMKFDDIIVEFRTRMPHLFKTILGASLSSSFLLSLEKIKEIMPKMCMIYAFIMQSNFAELSSFQHMVSFILQDASKRSFRLFNIFI